MKDYLLKGIRFIEDLKPSQWNAGVILKFKVSYLPKLKEFIQNAPEQEKKEDIVEVVKEIFNEKTN